MLFYPPPSPPPLIVKLNIIGFSIWLGCLCLLAVSCATKSEAFKDIDHSIDQSEFERGVEIIQKSQKNKKPIYNNKNAISLYMDKGLLEHYAGNYKNSSADLQEAERLIKEADTKSVTENVASYIANDNTKEYAGEDFENIYINVFNALNYYNQGDVDGALVEIRKLTQSGGKMDMLGRKYEDSRKRTSEQVMEKIEKTAFFKNTGSSINFSLPQGEPVNFSNSALVRYLGALFYLSEGKFDDARIEFNYLQQAFTNTKIYRNPIPSAVTDTQNIPKGKARLNIIGFIGLSPIKEEGLFQSAFPFLLHPSLKETKLKLPKLVDRPGRIDRIEIVIPKKNITSMSKQIRLI